MTHREFEGWNEYARRVEAARAAGSPDWARLPQTKRVMQSEGRKLFFTGRPCKHGHVSPRDEHGDCTQCRLVRADAV